VSTGPHHPSFRPLSSSSLDADRSQLELLSNRREVRLVLFFPHRTYSLASNCTSRISSQSLCPSVWSIPTAKVIADLNEALRLLVQAEHPPIRRSSVDQWLTDIFELYQPVNLSDLSAGADCQVHYPMLYCLHHILFLLLTTILAVRACATTRARINSCLYTGSTTSPCTSLPTQSHRTGGDSGPSEVIIYAAIYAGFFNVSHEFCFLFGLLVHVIHSTHIMAIQCQHIFRGYNHDCAPEQLVRVMGSSNLTHFGGLKS